MSFLFGPKVAEAEPAAAAADLADGNGVLVDVREDHEWRAGRAQGAIHIPLAELPTRIGELPRDAPIYLICASGNRSAKAAAFLGREGFPTAINVRGGTTAWSRAGLPVDR